MIQLVEFLEEIERNNQTVVIDGAEAERLVQRFGKQVRNIGIWNGATDGSITVPMSNITEAVQTLDNRVLTEAVQQLKTQESLTGILNHSSAAKQLIEALARVRLQQFERKVEQFQESDDSAETERLRREVSQELFSA